jgi:S1-C subfamily serine protease
MRRASLLVAGVAFATVAVLATRTLRAAPTEGQGIADFRSVVRSAKERVFPAVVFIKCIRESSEEGKKQGEEVGGSGVLISSAGEFVTNWHVVDLAREVRCLLSDGRSYHAKVLGSDKDTDVALCRIDAPAGTEPFPHAAFGDSDALVEGDFVMAMGAPWGLSRSVSIGIVACTRRYLVGTSEYSLWIQTDASISPGNSGGPLVSTSGAVVGLNARGTLQGGDLGFAIPASTVRLIVENIRACGKCRWTWTGVHLQPLRDFDKDTVFEGTDGVVVSGTDPDSPGRRTGLLPQDRLLSIGGRKTTALTIEDLPAVHRMLGTLPLDQPVVLRVRRDGKEMDLTLTPREKGSVEGDELACPRWDFSVKAINQFEVPELYFHRKSGVFVWGVKSPGNASTAGLARGDILLKVGGQEVRSLADVKAANEAAVAAVAKEPKVVFSLLRNGLLRQVVLDFSRDYERE